MQAGPTALELFCGIGGFSAAVAGAGGRVVGALDQSPMALDVYRLNFPQHRARQADLERVSAAELADFGADMWWLSPPCQPYSVRGRRQDMIDPRARSLARIMAVFTEIPEDRLPLHLALENVVGFAHSQAHDLLVAMLEKRGYHIRDYQLCPTELGIPSRRPRYYLVASRAGLVSPRSAPNMQPRTLRTFLDPSLDEPPADLIVAPEVVDRFGEGFRILDPDDPDAYTTCFTAGYGKSLMHAGSYLRCGAGVRRFSPQEITRLLCFPPTFRFPKALSLRKRWHLLGNSLSVAAVREVLRSLPGIDLPEGVPSIDGTAYREFTDMNS
jgi:DNA (cytosine-5)-methyltransferase 1